MVTNRTSAFPNQTQAWDYDRLGRVTEHRIRGEKCTTGPGPITCPIGDVAGERLAYDAVGNVRSVASLATNFTLAFTYDRQHQLATVTSTDVPQSYSADFSYSPGGMVWRARIGSRNASADVFPRHVEYDYLGDGSPGDPAAVRSLLNLSAADPQTAAPIATFDHDLRGNVTSPGPAASFGRSCTTAKTSYARHAR